MSDDDAEMDNFSEASQSGQEASFGVDMAGRNGPSAGDELVVTDDDDDDDYQQHQTSQPNNGGGYDTYDPWGDELGGGGDNGESVRYDFGGAQPIGGIGDGGNGGDWDESDSDGELSGDSEEIEEFDIEEEADEEAELLAQLEEIKTFDEWNALDFRTKLYSIVEPGITVEVELPPTNLRVTTVYAVIYFIVVALQVAALVLLSFDRQIDSQATSAFDMILLATIGFFALDFLFRVIFCTRVAKVPMIILDALTLGSTIIIYLDVASMMGYAEVIAPFRACRFFLITRLFLHTDTFRDINLGFITIANSAKSLSIFVCLLVVGLFVFSTAVYLLERGTFDPYKRQWVRECADLTGCTTEVSPFQSIPDALWLVINTMTTVGLGDVWPASTSGRIVTGLAMIAGVFVIAFPTMVLVGNLTLVRKNYFREEERERIMREDAELYFLEQARLAKEAEAQAVEEEENKAKEGPGMIDLSGEAKMEGEETASSLADSNNLLSPNKNMGYQSLHSLSQVGNAPSNSNGGGEIQLPVGNLQIANALADLKQRAYFAYMGDPTREVRMTRNPQLFHYQPILQVLCSEDGKPILSCVHQISQKVLTCQISLVLDDITAQVEAEKAVRGGDRYGEVPIYCRATPLYGLEVTLGTKIPGVRLNRRSDVGIIHDLTVPLQLTVAYDGDDDLQDRLDVVRQDLQNAQLIIHTSTQPMSSGLWYETVFITSTMLAPTPFVVDLKAISQHLSSDFLSGNEKARKDNPEKYLHSHADVAFITKRQLQDLMKPILGLLVTEGQVIRNATEVLDSLVRVVALHCRQLRLAEIPKTAQAAVMGFQGVKPHEKVYEVDVDFFRTADWPFGSVRVEKAARCKSLHISSIIGSGKGLVQPELFNKDAFTNPFRSEISLETTMARDHAVEEVQKAQQEQAKQLSAIAKRAEEQFQRRLKREQGKDEFDGIRASTAQGEEKVQSDEDEDYDSPRHEIRSESDKSEQSVDSEGLTREERHQVQQALLFGRKY